MKLYTIIHDNVIGCEQTDVESEEQEFTILNNSSLFIVLEQSSYEIFIMNLSPKIFFGFLTQYEFDTYGTEAIVTS